MDVGGVPVLLVVEYLRLETPATVCIFGSTDKEQLLPCIRQMYRNCSYVYLLYLYMLYFFS